MLNRFPGVVSLMLAAMMFAVPVEAQEGRASWYGGGEKLNTHTKSGEVFNPMANTCAHRRIKMGVLIRVRNLENGKTATCRVNDFGPAAWTGRMLDVSKGVAAQLGMLKTGVARVSVLTIE